MLRSLECRGNDILYWFAYRGIVAVFFFVVLTSGLCAITAVPPFGSCGILNSAVLCWHYETLL